jgi:hypothetical protein
MKTNELTGTALDWAVAKCEGYEIVRMRGNEITFLDRTEDGALSERHINYSTNWAQGGPIIEREGVCIQYIPAGTSQGWWAIKDSTFHDRSRPDEVRGETPLIAAMRCYVASKLGDEIEVPAELTKE